MQHSSEFHSTQEEQEKEKDMGGGTETFPDLGRHCQHEDCNQLDFLPFKCDGCQKVFCLEHRSFKSHDCPNSDRKSRKVIVCEVCLVSIETTGEFGDGEKMMLEKHKKSGDCDPKKKQKKDICPVKRCKEKLTFSNTATCKTCDLKVCLKHRFPIDHSCKKDSVLGKNSAMVGNGRWNDKFLVALVSRNGKECTKKDRSSAASSTSSSPSVKAY